MQLIYHRAWSISSLGQPIRKEYLSDAQNEATILYSHGEHTSSMLKKAEVAWSKNKEKGE